MSTYVIANQDSKFLDTPVFHAGPSGDEEALAVFTSAELAAKYIDDAGWRDQYEVGELNPIQLIRWLAVACDEGAELLAVNPDRSDHIAGQQQNVLHLNEPFGTFADLLKGEISKRAGQQTQSSS